ncbi:MAG: HU family DNA-binding protein [Pyrinomonadaceae bacterium]|nr:HU family DNA-binding protein [Phycisphaerales bacterium]
MAKKAAAKAPAAPKPKKIAASEKARSKSELFATLSDHTGLSKKEIASVFEGLNSVFAVDLGNKKGPRILNVPGMMKVYVRRVPAKPAREGVNPRTGEKMMYKAKPARDVVKVRALKMLKELA